MRIKKTLLVIFPGWSSFRELYDKLNIDYDELLYFDEFEIEKFCNKLSKYEYDKLVIVAWSMGTLMAIKVLEKIIPNKLILIAPTLNFTETTNPVILRKMINNLKKNKLLTIKEFNKINFSNRNNYEEYIKKFEKQLDMIEIEKLIDGLEYLMKEDISEIETIDAIIPLILLATKDNVITNENSIKVLEKFDKYILEVLDSGHNIIYEEKIEKIVGSYLGD